MELEKWIDSVLFATDHQPVDLITCGHMHARTTDADRAPSGCHLQACGLLLVIKYGSKQWHCIARPPNVSQANYYSKDARVDSMHEPLITSVSRILYICLLVRCYFYGLIIKISICCGTFEVCCFNDVFTLCINPTPSFMSEQSQIQ